MFRTVETITGRFFLAPHLYPFPRYSLRGGGEETIRQLLFRRSLSAYPGAGVSMTSSRDGKDVNLFGRWENIENGEELRAQCLAWYREMRVIQGH